MKPTSLLVVALLAAPAACVTDPMAPEDDAAITVTVSPLALAGITEVVYALRVENASGDLVWEMRDLRSTRYGDGRGGLSYVGPCDATSNPNRVALELSAMYTATGELGEADYRNPTATRPLVREVECRPNADTPVDFELVVLRSANQGFFDIAVNFEDIFCSAKLDCRDEQDEPLRLLHDPSTGERSTTVVLALACAAGGSDPTWLYMSDIHVACDDGSFYWVDPAAAPGNQAGQAELLFRSAIYRTPDARAESGCAWSVALGLTLPAAGRCLLIADATASGGELTDHTTPSGTVYPYIHYEAELTDANGQLACGRSAVNQAGSDVQTHYAQGATFAHAVSCAAPNVAATRPLCTASAGDIEGQISGGPSGLDAVIDELRSPLGQLPTGWSLAGCTFEAP